MQVGRRLAQGRLAQHLRRTAQTALGEATGGGFAVKADLLTARVAVDDHAMVQFECDAEKFVRQVCGPRTNKLPRSSARVFFWGALLAACHPLCVALVCLVLRSLSLRALRLCMNG